MREICGRCGLELLWDEQTQSYSHLVPWERCSSFLASKILDGHLPIPQVHITEIEGPARNAYQTAARR